MVVAWGIRLGWGCRGFDFEILWVRHKGEGVGGELSNRETEARVCELSGWWHWRMGDPWRILVGLGLFGGWRMVGGVFAGSG